MTAPETPDPAILERAAAETGIPLGLIKTALGVPLPPCPATTPEQAWGFFLNARLGSEEWQAARLKWRELATKEISQITNIPEEAWKAYLKIVEVPYVTNEELAAIRKIVELYAREAAKSAP